jgi:hypothetical protein
LVAAKPFAVAAPWLLTVLAAASLCFSESSLAAESMVADATAGVAAGPAPSPHDGFDPHNATGWFLAARARVSAGFAIGSPDDYCDADNNWIFLALSDLSEAIRLDAATATKLIIDDRTEFARFRDSPEFNLWWTTTRPLPATDSEMSAFFRNHPVWSRPGSNLPIRESLTLHSSGTALITTGGSHATKGAWRVARRGIVVVSNDRETSYELGLVPFFLAKGTKHFDTVTLGGSWTMGPILHDCADGP